MIESIEKILIQTIKNNVKGVSDSSRICPICGCIDSYPSSKEFVCSSCGSKGRSRLYYLYLQSLGIGVKKHRIMHIMPEQCIRYKINNVDNTEYVPAGLSDLSPINAEDGSFNLIIANYIVDRVDDPKGFLKEIKRVLSDDGVAMLSVHIFDEPDESSVPRKYGKEYPEMLEEAGFKVKVLAPQDVKPEDLIRFCGINPKERIVLATKN